jgi:D-glycero-D-manno-heptose 1,7-bisphosphate phosphatase
MGIRPVTPPPRRAVFLDRDGVLNEAVLREGKPYPPASPAEVRIVEGAAAGLRRLRERGFLLLVVTNQPDVARGSQSAATLDAINALLRQSLPLDDFFICLHDNADACPCRKPRPGLLLQAAAKYNLSLPHCFLIGDRWRDMDAAAAAAVPGVWIDYGYRERGPALPPAATVKNFAQAVDWILKQEDSG